MIHQLKCWPEPYRYACLGLKTHEFRKNDRNFQVGDTIHLCMWDPEKQQYSGHGLVRRVNYVGEGFGIPEGYVCMSLGLMPGLPHIPAIGEPS